MDCLVENCIFDIIEQHGELPFLVFDDLNARTGTANVNECVLPDSVLDVENDNEDAQNQYCRQSKDLHTNDFELSDLEWIFATRRGG